MILTYDTETTGLLNFKAPAHDPSQPRLVQLGALLQAEDGKTLAELNVIVKPDGFTIPEEASAVHGITTEIALAVGIPLKTVLRTFLELVRVAKVHVAHNASYDQKVLRGEFRRNGHELVELAKSFCTMQAMTDICRIPALNGRGGAQVAQADGGVSVRVQGDVRGGA